MASSLSGPERIKNSAAFTLVELVLTVALMLLLAGAVILNFGPLDRYSRLEEGANHLETLFRFARAQSSYTGRQIKIAFSHDMPGETASTTQTNVPAVAPSTNVWVHVLWESDPVGFPGRFQDFPAAEMLVEEVNNLVRVEAVGQPGTFSRKPGQSELALPAAPSLSMEETNTVSSTGAGIAVMPPVNCYPDGSSDSVEILLAPAGEGDQRRAVVSLSGISGRASHRIVAPAADGTTSAAEEEEVW